MQHEFEESQSAGLAWNRVLTLSLGPRRGIRPGRFANSAYPILRKQEKRAPTLIGALGLTSSSDAKQPAARLADGADLLSPSY